MKRTIHYAALAVLAALTISSAWADGIGVLVVDCNGNPIHDAFVLVAQPNGTFVRKGNTTPNGSLQFDFVTAGMYDVSVVCPNGKTLTKRVELKKGGQIRLEFRCPCTLKVSSAVSGVEGSWVVTGPAGGLARLKFDGGQFEISYTAAGHQVQARGIYRQQQANPDHPNEVVAALFQATSLSGVQLLMAEVDVCGPESAKEMHGSSPLFATLDNPYGMFVARREDAVQAAGNLR